MVYQVWYLCPNLYNNYFKLMKILIFLKKITLIIGFSSAYKQIPILSL